LLEFFNAVMYEPARTRVGQHMYHYDAGPLVGIDNFIEQSDSVFPDVHGTLQSRLVWTDQARLKESVLKFTPF
jgi:hypothetical protein